jgi:hypothetical protein
VLNNIVLAFVSNQQVSTNPKMKSLILGLDTMPGDYKYARPGMGETNRGMTLLKNAPGFTVRSSSVVVVAVVAVVAVVGVVLVLLLLLLAVFFCAQVCVTQLLA